MLEQQWRSTTARLVLSYGAFFTIWGVVLLNFLYWSTAHYLSEQTDRNLVQQSHYLTHLDRARMLNSLNDYVALDRRDFNSWGLFDANGHPLFGNVNRLPDNLEIGGRVRRFIANTHGSGWYGPGVEVRAVARRLDDGEILLLAHDTSVIDGVGQIIRRAMWWGLGLTLLPGLYGVYVLGRDAHRRILAIEAAIEPIRRGELGRRLPVSGRGDELDQLAALINGALGEIQRLMREVKGVCDSIAHDLRTPLTRLRAQLHRLRQSEHSLPRIERLEQCIGDVDELLGRFKALLRISELEDRRRCAGFVPLQLAQVLAQVHELYAPLAEEKALRFRLASIATPSVQADPDLLFEALGNLLGNAIKFTPAGGEVDLRLDLDEQGLPRITVEDTGPGIPEDERNAVWQRFYRGRQGERDGGQGHGLGLSIVAAIAKLHGFRLQIEGGKTAGAQVMLICGEVERPMKNMK